MLRSVSAFAAVAVFLASASDRAAAVTIEGHTPPHLLKQGTTAKPTVPGTVTVQVLVPATGPAVVKRVIKSSNHADDAAALEVARTSTYAPAVNDGKPNTEFYDFNVKFTGSGVAAAPAGSLASYEAAIRAGKYDDAKSGLTTYLSAHPTDPKALLDLGLTETFMNDTTGAAAAFVQVDTIPESFKASAHRALYEAAVADAQAKKSDEALAYAKKLVGVSPDYLAYAALGLASQSAGDGPGAVSAYEKARSVASSATAKERSLIDVNLVTAYLDANEPDKAKTAADEAKSLDPSTNVASGFGQYYAQQGKTKETAGDLAGAAAAYESGAAQDPGDAVTLSTNAAFDYLKMKMPDNEKAKAAAQKALAIDPADAGANFALGVALANTGHAADAVTALNKADATAKAKGETSLATQIETNLKNLSATK